MALFHGSWFSAAFRLAFQVAGKVFEHRAEIRH